MPTEPPITRESIARRPAMYFGDSALPAYLVTRLLRAFATELVGGTIRVTLGELVEIIVEGRRLPREFTDLDLEVTRTASVDYRVDDDECLSVRFRPDRAFLESLGVPWRDPLPAVEGVMATLAVAYPSIVFALTDERSSGERVHQCADGARERLMQLAANRYVVDEIDPLHVRGEHDDVRYDVAFRWAGGPGLALEASVNGYRTWAGGTHIYGVWRGLARGLSSFLKPDTELELGPGHIPRNAILVVVVHATRPGWGPATMDCLHDERIGRIIEDAVAEAALLYFRGMTDSEPPWQQVGGWHRKGSWIERWAARVAQADPTNEDCLCTGESRWERRKRSADRG